MLKYIPMTSENVFDVVKTQMEIFPSECGYFQYNFALNCGKDYWKYWLVYDENNIVAITGLYSDFDITETNSIWLGWFGVRPKYRKQKIGTEVLNFTINEAYKLAEKYPIKYFRLYTSVDENATAQLLYKKVMDFCEEYNCPNDFNYNNTCRIWTKILFNDKKVKWNNKCLGLKDIARQEKIYLDIFKKKYKNKIGGNNV